MDKMDESTTKLQTCICCQHSFDDIPKYHVHIDETHRLLIKEMDPDDPYHLFCPFCCFACRTMEDWNQHVDECHNDGMNSPSVKPKTRIVTVKYVKIPTKTDFLNSTEVKSEMFHRSEDTTSCQTWINHSDVPEHGNIKSEKSSVSERIESTQQKIPGITVTVNEPKRGHWFNRNAANCSLTNMPTVLSVYSIKVSSVRSLKTQLAPEMAKIDEVVKVSSVDELDVYDCISCKRSYRSLISYMTHARRFHSYKECSMCRQIRMVPLFLQHLEVEHSLNVRVAPRNRCAEKASKEAVVSERAHRYLHCCVCHRKCLSISSYQKHFGEAHPNKPWKIAFSVKCKLCGEQFISKSFFEMHFMIVHSDAYYADKKIWKKTLLFYSSDLRQNSKEILKISKLASSANESCVSKRSSNVLSRAVANDSVSRDQTFVSKRGRPTRKHFSKCHCC